YSKRKITMRDSVNKHYPKITSVAFIGNYLPRKCGIATFTTNLARSISSVSKKCNCTVVAMNDKCGGYNYPQEVCFEVNQDDTDCYYDAADYLNLNQPDVICLQHEFGIFGGQAGDYILMALENLHAPVVTTLHTILAEPTKTQKLVM